MLRQRSPCPDPEHQVNIDQFSVENTRTHKDQEGGGLLAVPGLRVSISLSARVQNDLLLIDKI